MILVLDRMWPEDRPIDSFLGDDASNAIVLCPKEFQYMCGTVKQTIAFDNYLYNDDVKKTAIGIAREQQITKLIATHEFDLVRAGEIRDNLNLEGQTELSATAYRDKLLMKQYIRKAGLATASFLPLDDNFTLNNAANILKLPLVVKPRKGAGSKAVEIIKDQQAILSWDERNPTHSDMMVEEYMAHDMYHVDGFLVGDKIYGLTVSKYIGTCLGVKFGESLGSIQLRDETKLFKKVQESTLKILAALPSPDATPFHLEIFIDKNDNIIFSEIASRVAGGNIDQIVELRNNIDLTDTWIKYQLNKNLDNLSKIKTSAQVFGLIIFPPKMGVLEKIPTECPLSNVVRYIVKSKVGDSFTSIRSSADCFAYAIVSGYDEQELENSLLDLKKWFYQNLKIAVSE